MKVYARSSAAANFMAMFVEEELGLDTPVKSTPNGHCVELSEEDIEDMISCAEEYNDIERNEWKIAIEESNFVANHIQESTSESDRIYVAAKTAEAKDALEDAGYERSGIVFDMTAGELADVLETIDIDLDEIDVKDESGEPIEDVYSYVFDTDEVYDEYDEDYADFDFDEEDDYDDIDPEFFDMGEEGFDEEDF